MRSKRPRWKGRHQQRSLAADIHAKEALPLPATYDKSTLPGMQFRAQDSHEREMTIDLPKRECRVRVQARHAACVPAFVTVLRRGRGKGFVVGQACKLIARFDGRAEVAVLGGYGQCRARRGSSLVSSLWARKQKGKGTHLYNPEKRSKKFTYSLQASNEDASNGLASEATYVRELTSNRNALSSLHCCERRRKRWRRVMSKRMGT